MYSDVTFRPQISPGARAWSVQEKISRDAEAHREGRPAPTVFERLYHIAVQERAQRVARQALPAPSAAPGVPRSPGSDVASGTEEIAAFRRRPPATKLLYSDALDRRERQRAMEEQEQDYWDNERRMSCQVLTRSRRYYWQMLERQIKSAFDTAHTAEDDCLTYPMLEDFLRNFGCLSSAKCSTQLAVDRAAEDSRKLRVALWRHLDPTKRGFVDFLTLTVFFHVLMGAVDEEAQCLHNISLSNDPQTSGFQEDSQQSMTSPSRGVEHALSFGSRSPEGGSAGALGAIFEECCLETDGVSQGWSDQEETPERSTGAGQDGQEGNFRTLNRAASAPPSTLRDDSASAATAAAAAAAATADPEGRRICELLMRFNPKQLRAEFRQLYLDRLHLTSASATPSEDTLARHQAPEVNNQSRQLAERLVQREREDAGGNLASHAELLHWRDAQAKAKREEKRIRREAEEVEECTFHPVVKNQQRNIAIGAPHREPGMLYDRLYSNARERQRDLEDKAAAHEHHRSAEEREACTFRPDTSRSGKSYQRHGYSDPSARKTVHPRGYDQCKQRLRRAFAGHVQRRRDLENRFTPIDAVPRGQNAGVEARRQPSPAPAALTNAGRGDVSSPQVSNGIASSPAGRPPTSPATPSAVGSSPMATAGARGGVSTATLAASPSQPRVMASPRGARAPGRGIGTQQRPPQGTSRDQPPQGAAASGARSRSAGNSAGTKAPRSQGNSAGPGTAPPDSHLAVGSTGKAPAVGSGGTGKTSTAASPAAPQGPANAASMQVGEEKVEEALNCSDTKDTKAVSVDEAAPPLVFVEVNIAYGKPPERLILHEGQTPAEAAAEFAVAHHLPPQLAKRLYVQLEELLLNPELPGRGVAPVP